MDGAAGFQQAPAWRKNKANAGCSLLPWERGDSPLWNGNWFYTCFEDAQVQSWGSNLEFNIGWAFESSRYQELSSILFKQPFKRVWREYYQLTKHFSPQQLQTWTIYSWSPGLQQSFEKLLSKEQTCELRCFHMSWRKAECNLLPYTWACKILRSSRTTPAAKLFHMVLWGHPSLQPTQQLWKRCSPLPPWPCLWWCYHRPGRLAEVPHPSLWRFF